MSGRTSETLGYGFGYLVWVYRLVFKSSTEVLEIKYLIPKTSAEYLQTSLEIQTPRYPWLDIEILVR